MSYQTLQTGVQNVADGSLITARADKQGAAAVSELHGRYYMQNYYGNLYSIGSSTTALSANTITLTSTTTPIVGVYNPSNSPVNLVILQASLQVSVQAASSTAQGSWVWASSIGNTAISTGSAPFNRKTLKNTGSQALGFPGGTALTGLTNNLVIFENADFGGGLAITTASVAATTPVLVTDSVQNFDGSLIVPPGGVLALLNTVSTTNLSVASRLMWEEVPV
jgi:hypothetical protein